MPRIIAGQLKGRPIPGSVGRGTRPTSDRVREAIFSRLNGWDAIAGAGVLDLFAGTGALGLESLSRGAASALLVEAHAPSARQLERSVRELGLRERASVRAARAEQVVRELAGGPQRFDLVFLDPPYEFGTEQLEGLLVELGPALASEALVVVERSSRTPQPAWPAGWVDDGTKSYGETVVHYGGPAAPDPEASHAEAPDPEAPDLQ